MTSVYCSISMSLPRLYASPFRASPIDMPPLTRTPKPAQAFADAALAAGKSLQSGSKFVFWRPCICTGARRNPATCSAYQGFQKRRFGPTLSAGWWDSACTGTHETVRARLWSWLAGESPENLSSCSLLARKRILNAATGTLHADPCFLHPNPCMLNLRPYP